MSSTAKQNTKAKIAELADGLSTLESKLREISKDLRKVAGRKRNTTSSSNESEEPKPKSRSAWQDWNSECTKRFASDYAAHLEEIGKKSDAITFASKCRSSTHIAEWEEYLATWNAAHPKVEKPKKSGKSKPAITVAVPTTVEDDEEAVITSSNSAAATLPTASPAPPSAKPKKSTKKAANSSDSEGEAPAKKKPAKKVAATASATAATAATSDSESAKKSKGKKNAAADSDSDTASAKKTRVVKNAAIDSSDEEGSVKKAKKSTKEEKAAAKAAATAAATAAAVAEPPTPWKWRGKDYLKNESNQVWQVGPEGEVGDWVGTFDGSKNSIKKSEGPL